MHRRTSVSSAKEKTLRRKCFQQLLGVLLPTSRPAQKDKRRPSHVTARRRDGIGGKCQASGLSGVFLSHGPLLCRVLDKVSFFWSRVTAAWTRAIRATWCTKRRRSAVLWRGPPTAVLVVEDGRDAVGEAQTDTDRCGADGAKGRRA